MQKLDYLTNIVSGDCVSLSLSVCLCVLARLRVSVCTRKRGCACVLACMRVCLQILFLSVQILSSFCVQVHRLMEEIIWQVSHSVDFAALAQSI